MRILGTGASGFLGRAIIAAGAEAGHHLIAASRAGTPVAGAGAVQACGDLAQGIGGIDLAGVDAVVHCAARVHVTRREAAAQAVAAYRAMNADLPVKLAEAARAAGASRFIQISSVAALASRTAPGATLDDLRPRRRRPMAAPSWRRTRGCPR